MISQVVAQVIASEIVDHLWQSTLLALIAGLIALALRNNAARIRYWVWFGASLKFLVPLQLLMLLGSELHLGSGATAVQGSAAPAGVIMQFGVALSAPALALRASAVANTYLSTILLSLCLSLWALGCAALLARWLASWVRLRAIVHAADPAAITAPIPVRLTRAPLEPGVLGVVRPVLVLPAGITERLTPPQLATVIAHELAHVRRGDNLTAAIHMVIQAAFWFHPLLWWIGARLVEERERACDEAVLQLGNDGQTYAESILKVCQLYVESKLACVAGVTGSSLKKRIEVIMSNRAIERLSAAKKLLLATAASAVTAVPICIGLAAPPAAVAQAATGERPGAATLAPVITNFKDADIMMVAEAVGVATGKNFIVGPHVSAQVTLQSSTPLSPAAFYQAFVSILEVYGYKTERGDDASVIKVVPDENAQQHLPEEVTSGSDMLVTEVVGVTNVGAAQLIPILRPMLPDYGHLTAYPAANILIISDRASNVKRITGVIHAIDQVGTKLQMPLQNGGAQVR